MRKILFAASVALVLGSCSNEISESYKTPGDLREMTVQTYTAGNTRLYNEANDQTLVSDGFMLYVESAGELKYNQMMYFVKGQDNDPGHFMFGTVDEPVKVTWPYDETQQVNFIGLHYAYMYYPDGFDADNGFKLDVAQILTHGITSYDHDSAPLALSSSGSETTDIIVTRKSATFADTNETGVIELQFGHILSKVKMMLKGEAGKTYDVSEVIMTAKSAASVYDLSTGDWSSASDADAKPIVYMFSGGAAWISSIAFDGGTDAVALAKNENDYDRSMVLIPGDYTISISYQYAQSGTYSYSEVITKQADVSINAGESNVFVLNIGPNKTQLVIDASLSDWSTADAQTPELD
ncbi:MAG: fimbrillin family protein [Bacteroidales bacterium]|nr:fimbrillin family protein [Candidatus Liminaster caballi]